MNENNNQSATNSAMFRPIIKILAARRPAWSLQIEDTLSRVITHQSVVDWAIFDEILADPNYQVVDIINTNSTLGLMVCIAYIGGK